MTKTQIHTIAATLLNAGLDLAGEVIDERQRCDRVGLDYDNSTRLAALIAKKEAVGEAFEAFRTEFPEAYDS